MKLLAPSILAGNHANLVNALELAEGDGRKWIHLDIMDGHFVPNLSFGPQTVSSLLICRFLCLQMPLGPTGQFF